MELSLRRCSNATWRSRRPTSSETFTESLRVGDAALGSTRSFAPGAARRLAMQTT